MERAGLRRWWPLLAVAAIAVVVAVLMYWVWKNSGDLPYASFALSVAVLVAGRVTWAWRKADPVDNAPDGEKLDRAADRLAAAVQSQWEKAAGERGLAGADPIQVTWGRPSVPMAGPLPPLSVHTDLTRCPDWRQPDKHSWQRARSATCMPCTGGWDRDGWSSPVPPGQAKAARRCC